MNDKLRELAYLKVRSVLNDALNDAGQDTEGASYYCGYRDGIWDRPSQIAEGTEWGETKSDYVDHFAYAQGYEDGSGDRDFLIYEMTRNNDGAA